MKNMNSMIEKNDSDNCSLAQDTRGLSTVEYLILLVVIGVAGISIWKQVGTSIANEATTAKQSIDGL